MGKIDLAADPLAIFRHSKTPPGLYARQKWLNEIGQAQWREDFLETVNRLYQGQSKDGSWDQAPLETIRRLFGRHLTVRAADPSVEAALKWLTSQARTVSRDQAHASDQELQGLPFKAGRPDVLYRSAVVFLATIFGFGKTRPVRQFLQDLTGTLNSFESLAADGASVSNILRALVVQPDPAQQTEVNTIIGWVGRRQQQNGTWAGLLPFCATVNALAHLVSPETDQILSKAFRRIGQTQHAAGHWGDGDREWHTFLLVHALRNRNML